MEYREAIAILLKIHDKHPLSKQEKEAVSTAIGTLDWFALGKNRLKGMIKRKKEKQ